VDDTRHLGLHPHADGVPTGQIVYKRAGSGKNYNPFVTIQDTVSRSGNR
jgi:hypothetical protein